MLSSCNKNPCIARRQLCGNMCRRVQRYWCELTAIHASREVECAIASLFNRDLFCSQMPPHSTMRLNYHWTIWTTVAYGMSRCAPCHALHHASPWPHTGHTPPHATRYGTFHPVLHPAWCNTPPHPLHLLNVRTMSQSCNITPHFSLRTILNSFISVAKIYIPLFLFQN